MWWETQTTLEARSFSCVSLSTTAISPPSTRHVIVTVTSSGPMYGVWVPNDCERKRSKVMSIVVLLSLPPPTAKRSSTSRLVYHVHPLTWLAPAHSEMLGFRLNVLISDLIGEGRLPVADRTSRHMCTFSYIMYYNSMVHPLGDVWALVERST